MQYDPIKDNLSSLIRTFPALRKLFYYALDMLFLRQMYVKKIIKSLFSQSDEIMFYDAGSGFCQYSDFILSGWINSEVYAIDLKSDYLVEYDSYSKTRYPNRFYWETADLVEHIPRKQFNLIAAIDILEHIENDVQVMTNFYSCLVDKGKLIISTPSNIDETARYTAEHVRPGYNLDELKLKLNNVGFSNIKSFFTYGKWGKISWKFAIKYPLEILQISRWLIVLLPMYYIFFYPIIYVLMKIDIRANNYIGNGIIVIAEKNANAS